MKKSLPGLLLGLVLGAALTWLLLTPRPAANAAAEPVPARAPEPASASLRLSTAQLAAAALQVAPPRLVTLAPEIQAYGRVLDPTPLVAAATDVATAQAALAASEKEYARAKSLHDEGDNASTQVVEAAAATARHDRIQLASARARFVAAWGPALATQLDDGFITRAIAQGWAFARIDVPPGEGSGQPAPKTARLRLLSSPAEPFEAEVLGPASTVDPQLQGRGFLVLLRDHPLPAGTALRASLPGAGAAAPHPILPRSAFVRHEGSVFVFVQTAADTFVRRRVELGPSLPHGIAVNAGLDEHDRVVVTGAQQLLSQQLGGED